MWLLLRLFRLLRCNSTAHRGECIIILYISALALSSVCTRARAAASRFHYRIVLLHLRWSIRERSPVRRPRHVRRGDLCLSFITLRFPRVIRADASQGPRAAAYRSTTTGSPRPRRHGLLLLLLLLLLLHIIGTTFFRETTVRTRRDPIFYNKIYRVLVK
jgi:hypothetical protein